MKTIEAFFFFPFVPIAWLLHISPFDSYKECKLDFMSGHNHCELTPLMAEFMNVIINEKLTQ
jgi:hypothetical protein